MGVRAVYQAMQDKLVPIIAGLGQKIPNFQFGDAAASRIEAPPRIIWVPHQGTVSGPGQRGGDDVGNPRALWRRDLRVEAHVWGAGEDADSSYDAAEELMSHMVAALNASVGGAAKPLGERWEPVSDLDHGRLVILTLQVSVPFADEPRLTTRATSAPVTGQFTELS